jgi:LmbE family N-acetylglucosaminyl deacetylase
MFIKVYNKKMTNSFQFKWSLKTLARQFNQSLMNRSVSPYLAARLNRSAIVFAPHQDDETLGCGGTIARKKQAQAELGIVFMTDGARSHSKFIAEAELKAIRKQEALAATAILGVPERDVIFLDIRDGSLQHCRELAGDRVKEILSDRRPQEIFIPYSGDTPPDHYATNQIVRKALEDLDLNAAIYEYPIWFWRHWPWTSFVGNRQEKLDVLSSTWKAQFGLKLAREFRYAIDISDVLETKKKALNCYHSQMVRLTCDRWPILADVSNGEFLECFLQNREFFYLQPSPRSPQNRQWRFGHKAIQSPAMQGVNF